MRKYDIIIAIDGDVSKSGVAFLERQTRRLEVANLTFPCLIDYLQTEADRAKATDAPTAKPGAKARAQQFSQRP